jgi:hypothetical protein
MLDDCEFCIFSNAKMRVARKIDANQFRILHYACAVVIRRQAEGGRANVLVSQIHTAFGGLFDSQRLHNALTGWIIADFWNGKHGHTISLSLSRSCNTTCIFVYLFKAHVVE